MATALGTVIDFLRDFGFFDVILPFLLIFTIIFGILEKTRIFGVYKIGEHEYPKKNLNAMVAFTVAFFAIAAKEVVRAIQVSLPQVALGLVFVVSFLMLAGSFLSDKEFSFENRKGWKAFLTFIMFVSIVLIFLNSLGWLDAIYAWIALNPGEILVPLIFIIVLIAVILYIVGVRSPASSKKEEQ